jgi:hypothetical protein
MLNKFSNIANALFIAGFAVAPVVAQAQSCSVSSPAYTVALLELYTSEGCDSCPPADKFLSAIQHTAGITPARVIPLALHVDYWDYLGWKDRFANPLFGERQRTLTSLSGSRTVYTPQLFISGKEARNWRSGISDAVRNVNAKPAQANLRLSVQTDTAQAWKLEIDAHSQQAATLYYAVTENALQSQVNAGENRGATLQHDAVVRTWGEAMPLQANTDAHFLQNLRIPQQAQTAHLSIVAFVQSGSGEILQAVSLPLCAPAKQTAAHDTAPHSVAR